MRIQENVHDVPVPLFRGDVQRCIATLRRNLSFHEHNNAIGPTQIHRERTKLVIFTFAS